MNFGKVIHPENVEFRLPHTHSQTKEVLQNTAGANFEDIRVGCAKWNRKDLKSFYPRGTKDELEYYSSQFNSIELNASFYRMFSADQFQKWHDKSAKEFKFFPKVPRLISHTKRLKDCDDLVTNFVSNLSSLQEKLGMVFLQMPENFHPKNVQDLSNFLQNWPYEIPLAVELRHTDWHNNKEISNELNSILLKHNIASIITDSAGRRDLLHMRLTNNCAFIRYNGANHASDYSRLDDWVAVIKKWQQLGLKKIYFFVHQNLEKASPLLSAYFIEALNKELNTNLKIPNTYN